MRRVTVRAIAAAALVATSCGGEEPRPVPAAAPTPPASAPTHASRDAASEQKPASDGVEVLWSAWRDAREPEDQRRAGDALLAVGTPALERLLAALAPDSEDYDFRVTDLVRAFGTSAVLPLVRRLDADDAVERARAMDLLGDLCGLWAFGDLGPVVCRALLARLADDHDLTSAQRALQRSRPAGRAIASDVAALWSAAEGGRREVLAEILMSLGPDAADAGPSVWAALVATPDGASEDAAFDAVARRAEALRILAATRGGDPALVEPLRKLLADGPPDVRADVLGLLGACGESAVAAAPQIAACLDDQDGDVCSAAARALRAMPSAAERVWRALAAAGHAEEVLAAFAKDAAFAARMAEALPTLPAGEIETVVDALRTGGAMDARSLTTQLLRHPLPEARALALASWVDAGRPGAVPDGALDLLDDPDPRVRAHAVASLAGVASVPGARVRDAAGALLSAEDAAARRDAVRALGCYVEDDAPARDAVIRASGDPDAWVRGIAVGALSRVAARAPGAMAAIVAGLADAAPGVRREAVERLAPLAGDSPAAFTAIVPILTGTDAELRIAALAALGVGSTPIAGDHAALVATLARDLFTSKERVSRLVVRLLLRLEGGTAAVCQAISRTLDADDQENLAHLQEAIETIGLLGPRAASLRPALVRRRDISDAYWRLVIDRALDAIDGKGEPPADPSDEAEVLARSSAGDDEKVARLHELGEAGARAMLRVAAETRDADALLVRIAPIADAPLRDVIRDAAGATGSDPASALRRRGAAVLASLLPPADAIALLTRLHDRGDTAEIALESLCRVESGSPGSVPVALAARLLRDGDGHRDWDGLPLAERIGPRMLAADADLVPELRWVRDTGVLYDVHREAALGSPGAAPAAQASPAMWLRCAGAVALWRLTRHEDEALPLFRSLLEHPERIGRRDDDQIPWTTVGEVLAEMTLGDEDVAAIVVTLRAASAHVHHDADESDPGGTDAVAGAVVPLCAVLRRLGPRAAPAVPALRVALPHRVGARGEPVVATLVAIGSAAREAIPDIRVWAAHDERCRRVASDAIRAIESAPR